MSVSPLAIGILLVQMQELRWEVPASCPDATWADGQLEDLLGGTTDERHGTVAIVREGHDTWRVGVEVDGRVELRAMRASSCAPVARTALLLVAILWPGERPFPASVAVEPELPAAGPDPEPPVPAREPPAAWSERELGWFGAVGVDARAAPALGAGVLSFGLRGRGAAVEIYGGGQWPRALGPLRADVVVHGFAGGLRPCGVVARERWALRICAAYEAGVLRGRARRGEQRRTQSLPWFAVTAGVWLLLPIRPRLAMRLGVELVQPLVAGTFVIESIPSGTAVGGWGPRRVPMAGLAVGVEGLLHGWRPSRRTKPTGRAAPPRTPT